MIGRAAMHAARTLALVTDKPAVRLPAVAA